MSKYPFTFDEFNKAIQDDFINSYYKNNPNNGLKILKDNDVKEMILDAYNGNKYKHEQGIAEAAKDIKDEVSGTVYCISMF